MNFYIKLKHQQFRLKRSQIRPKVAKIMLTILLWTFLITGANEQLTSTKTILIENVQANSAGEVSTLPRSEPDGIDKDLSKSGDSIALSPAQGIEKMILDEFGTDGRVALAVFTAESRLNIRAINYNCEGYPNGICPKGLEYKAWSVDCGLAQINILGKSCPTEMFDPLTNIKKAKEMHAKRGFAPWCTFKDKVYLSYL